MTTRTLQMPRPDVTWVDITKNEVVGFGKDITESAPHLETRVFSTHQIIRHDWVAQAPPVKESSRDIFYRAGLQKGLRILNVNFPDDNTWFDIGDYTSLAACAATLGPPLREPVRCLTLSQAEQATHQRHLINTHLSTGVINRLRSSFALPSGESLASRVMNLLHQSNCLGKDETRLLTVAPGEPRVVLCAEACPVDLPFPLLRSLEDPEGASSFHSVQSSSTLFLFPTQNTTPVQ